MQNMFEFGNAWQYNKPQPMSTICLCVCVCIYFNISKRASAYKLICFSIHEYTSGLSDQVGIIGELVWTHTTYDVMLLNIAAYVCTDYIFQLIMCTNVRLGIYMHIHKHMQWTTYK